MPRERWTALEIILIPEDGFFKRRLEEVCDVLLSTYFFIEGNLFLLGGVVCFIYLYMIYHTCDAKPNQPNVTGPAAGPEGWKSASCAT